VERVSSDEVSIAVDEICRAGIAPGTLADALSRSETRPAVAEAIRARVEVSCAHPADDLDSGVLGGGAAEFGEFDSYTVDGGNDLLAKGLAEPLGSRLHLSSPVRALGWSDSQVQVVTADGSASADAAVIAVPASVMESISFDPSLPDEKAAALRHVTYGHAAKLFVALRERAEPSATLSVAERFWCYTQLGADGRPVPLVGAFAGTLPALERLEISRGPERWLESLAQLRPDLELEPESTLLSRWDDDPWMLGAYSASSASRTVDNAEVARPVGRLAFAGEHTAGEWYGLMEGALRSGRRAADELLATAGFIA
jgi:monoamine oxidase